MLVRHGHALLALIWLAIVCASAVFVVQCFYQKQALFSSDLFEFLPELKQSDTVKPAVEQVNSALNRQFVVLISGSDTSDTSDLVDAMDRLSADLIDSGDWALSADYQAARDMEIQAIWNLYQRYGGRILTLEDRNRVAEALQNDDYSSLYQDVAFRLTSPAGFSVSNLKTDPLFFLQNFIAEKSGSLSVMNKASQWPLLTHDQRQGIVAVFETSANIYDLTRNARLAQQAYAVRERILSRFDGIEVTMTGAFLHVDQGSRQARSEVTTIGLVSLLAIGVLLGALFRSLAPILATLLVLSTGLMMAFSAVLLLFGQVQALVMVICATVIGLGVDYTLHYFAHQQVGQSPMETIRRIWRPTGIGMATSALAFMSLSLLPFPGFQQVALMMAVGLLAVWLSMVLWFPYLSFVSRTSTASIHSFSKASQGLASLLKIRLPRKLLGKSILLWLAIALMMGYGLLNLHANDDIRQLQTFHPELQQADATLSSWLGIQKETAFFVVTGDTAEQALFQVEKLCHTLRQDFPDNVQSLQCLSDWLPSRQSQEQNAALLAELAEKGRALWLNMSQMGLSQAVLASYREFISAPGPVLEAQAFWSSPWTETLRPLWVADESDTGKVAIIVRLSGVQDHSVFSMLARQFDTVHWVDPVNQYTEVFRHFREFSTLFVFGSYMIILLALALRYGIQGALRIIIPVGVAGVGVLCILSITGVHLNLFSVMALMLVTGMGVDYGVFLLESPQFTQETMMAVFAAALTTILAFGLLALSETNAIRSFGVVITSGVSFVLITTVIMNALRRERQE